MPCPKCGRSLIPVSSGATVTFHCKNGHELSLLDLLSSQSAALKAGLENLLAEWDHQYEAILGSVEDAQRNGFLNIAEIFQRHAESVESRIEILRSAFNKADSTKLTRFPTSARPE